jgi:diguanylate cyclase (GGDEF)-like protein
MSASPSVANPAPETHARRLFRVGLVSVLICVAGAALAAGGAVQVRRDISKSESEGLAERARQTTTLFTSVAQGFNAVLTTGSLVAEVTDGNTAAFARTVNPRLAQTFLSNAVLLEVRGDRIDQLSWVGRTRPVLLSDLGRSARQTLNRVAGSGELFVVARGARAGAKVLGIAAAAHPRSRYVGYAEVSIPKAVSFGNLHGIDFGFYLGQESPGRLFVANTSRLPIRGHRLVVRIDSAGLGQQPLLVFGGMQRSALSSLAPWLVFALGSLVSLTLAAQFEAMRRRRDTALALVDDLEAKNTELDRQGALNRHQALHDALTGLPNRTLFHDRIEQAILRDRREDDAAAVIMIDLDHFKEVNDSLGHHSGDLLLQSLSLRLAGSIRASDTVSRLGGDEFGVLIGSIAGPWHALAIATKIHAALTQPVELDDLSVEVNASIGIAIHPDHGETVDALLQHADVALYRSKEIHAPVVYSTEHDNYSPTRLRLITGLRRAIEDGEIVVYYQPQAVTRTREIEAVEALVRWQHPELGLIPPDQFIPLAEQTGTIRPLTRHVLKTALTQCRDWRNRGWPIRVAVNICARDLLDVGFPDEVLTALRTAGVSADMLELEITEDTILTDAVRARAVVKQLSQHGVRFAIDDFGTGQSSLAYLKRLPVQVLKIDQSFVLGMAHDSNDAVIVRSTIDLAHNLQLKVIAEGVETARIRKQLALLGCDAVQGDHLGRPAPAAEIEALFTSSCPARARAIAPASQAIPEPA